MLDEYIRVSKVLRPLSGPLARFVYLYANADPSTGGTLAVDEDLRECLLFSIWLEACKELGITCDPPQGEV